MDQRFICGDFGAPVSCLCPTERTLPSVSENPANPTYAQQYSWTTTKIRPVGLFPKAMHIKFSQVQSKGLKSLSLPVLLAICTYPLNNLNSRGWAHLTPDWPDFDLIHDFDLIVT